MFFERAQKWWRRAAPGPGTLRGRDRADARAARRRDGVPLRGAQADRPHRAGGGARPLAASRRANTRLGDRPVTGALCRLDGGDRLTGVVEGAVHVGDDGLLTWRPVGEPESEAQVMQGDEPVSMNLWGFTPAIVPVLTDAFAAFSAGGGIAAGEELFLPNVVGERLGAPTRLDVTVLVSDDRCLGVTHPDDVPLLQATLTGPAW